MAKKKAANQQRKEVTAGDLVRVLSEVHPETKVIINTCYVDGRKKSPWSKILFVSNNNPGQVTIHSKGTTGNNI